MSLRPSHWIRLTTSVTWVERLTFGPIRWLRSPTPVSVGVNTLWPCFSSRSDTRRQHQPPCQAPCTRTKVWAIQVSRLCKVVPVADCGVPPTSRLIGDGDDVVEVAAYGCFRSG